VIVSRPPLRTWKSARSSRSTAKHHPRRDRDGLPGSPEHRHAARIAGERTDLSVASGGGKGAFGTAADEPECLNTLVFTGKPPP
jgi:hypothetical protein